MIDGLPLDAVSGIGVVGVVIVVGWMIATGRLITSREAGLMTQRIESLEAQVKDLSAQNILLLREGLPNANAVLDAIKDLAERRPPT